MKVGRFKGQVLSEIMRSKMLAKYSGMEDTKCRSCPRETCSQEENPGELL